MNKNLARLLKQQILETANYADMPQFPACVEVLNSFEELVNWLGTADFSATHSGSYAATQELVRVANSVERGMALRKFADWTMTQSIEDPLFSSIVVRDVGFLKAELDRGRLQDAFEAAASKAARVAEQVPGYRAALGQWVLARQMGG